MESANGYDNVKKINGKSTIARDDAPLVKKKFWALIADGFHSTRYPLYDRGAGISW
jgi:hypothetical protein